MKRILLPLLAVLGACAAEPEGPTTAVVAHRGASGDAPENTLAAVSRALELGADWIELDVRLSADGRAVLVHDADVERTSDGTGLVAELDFATLRELDVGSWFDARFADERVPSVEETAALAGDAAGLMLDLKLAGAGAAIASDLAAAGFDLDRVLVGAWDDAQLADATEHLEGATMLFIGEVPEGATDTSWIDALAEKGYEALSLSWEGVTSEVLTRAHAFGLDVHVWTVNERGDMERVVEAGVDGVITDQPALLVEVLAGE